MNLSNFIIPFIYLSTLFLFSSCEIKEEKKLNPIEASSEDEFIRSPLQDASVVLSEKHARIGFDREILFFDTVHAGHLIEKSFHFINEGPGDLIIEEVRSSCGCTIPYFPEDPIAVGERAEISVQFNTSGKNYLQDTPISIFANTIPRRTVIRLKGYVVPENES